MLADYAWPGADDDEGMGRKGRVYSRSQELAETCGTMAQRFSLLAGLFGTAYVGGRFAEARDRLEHTRSFTSQHPEPAILLEVRYQVVACAFHQRTRGIAALRRGRLALFERPRSR